MLEKSLNKKNRVPLKCGCIIFTKPTITVVNAYRPPSLSVAQFDDKFADVLTPRSVLRPSTSCWSLSLPASRRRSSSAEFPSTLPSSG